MGAGAWSRKGAHSSADRNTPYVQPDEIHYPDPVEPFTKYTYSRTPLSNANPPVYEQYNLRPSQTTPIVWRGNRDTVGEFAETGVHPTPLPQVPMRPAYGQSSRYQPGQGMPSRGYFNLKWYIAFPAATLSYGIDHNLGLSERAPQLVTNKTGGPTAATMERKGAFFTKVQKVRRPGTAPGVYNTQSGGA